MFMLMHDVGEIKRGDALDDGSGEHEARLKDEAEVFEEMLTYLPESEVEWFRTMRERFENYEGHTAGLDKIIDKLEAILYLLFLETKGLFGWLRNKEYPSERDLKMAEFAGTDCCTDVWTVHYRTMAEKVPVDIREVANSILRQSFLTVRGEVPQAFTRDLSELSL